MKDIVRYFIQITLGIVFILGVLMCAVKCSYEHEEKKWNNGYCECGGHFEYEQAVGHQGFTSYLYRCDSCGKHIELSTER